MNTKLICWPKGDIPEPLSVSPWTSTPQPKGNPTLLLLGAFIVGKANQNKAAEKQQGGKGQEGKGHFVMSLSHPMQD